MKQRKQVAGKLSVMKGEIGKQYLSIECNKKGNLEYE